MNQPNNYQDNQQAALVTDLPLTSEQAAQTKAGTTSGHNHFIILRINIINMKAFSC